jgi:DNA-binding GntR family transcriptional regulator
MDQKDLQMKLAAQPFASLNQNVYELLFQEIISLRIAPGSKVNELQIANHLGVSRSPVKMAIERLYQEGLIEKTSGRVSKAASVGYEDCMQLCEMRRAIECEAAFLAAKRISRQELLSLKNILQQFKHSDDENLFSINIAEIDSQFHHIIIEASNNKYIKAAYNNIKNGLLRYRYFIYDHSDISKKTSIHEVFKCHQAICHAIENGYSTVARDESAQDIEMMQLVVRLLN